MSVSEPSPGSARRPKKLDYVVAGTGRSGTVYMARLLSSVGVVCSHEGVFNLGRLEKAQERMRTGSIETSHVSDPTVAPGETPNWFDVHRLRADSSWMAVPYLDQAPADEAAIVHVVRNPLRVVSSWVEDLHCFRDGPTDFGIFRDFVLEWLPDVMLPRTEVERACRYWLEWNEMVERNYPGRRVLRCRVEDLPNETLMNFLDVPSGLRIRAFTNRRANTWSSRSREYTLGDIPGGEIRERLVAAAERYGYDVTETEVAG